MDSISDYGILGYGVDIINNQPLQPLVAFTYDKKQTFEFQKKILIPDQFRFDPTPQHKLSDQRFSGVMQSAREYQRNLSTERGLGGVVDGVEFSGEASTVNSLFKSESSKTARQYVSICGEYVILGLDGVLIREAIQPAVKEAARAVLGGHGSFTDFFAQYGTHIVSKASVGGQIKINTDLTLDTTSSKTMSSARVSISAQAKLEAVGYASGKMSFDTRSTTDDTTYRKSSNVAVSLTGGNIAAKDFNGWRDSLNCSEIFSHPIGAEANLRFAQPPQDGSAKHYLGLVNHQYVPLHSVLSLNDDNLAKFAAALKKYLGGVNPFEDKVQRLDPAVPESSAIKLGKSHRFTMRGWMATYETYAGLCARPGAHAVVQCKSDAEPGGWTEKTVYGGENVLLRGKTGYLSKYMDVKFVKIHGDEGADVLVYARNRLVSW